MVILWHNDACTAKFWGKGNLSKVNYIQKFSNKKIRSEKTFDAEALNNACRNDKLTFVQGAWLISFNSTARSNPFNIK